MNVYYDFIIPAFVHHVTVSYNTEAIVASVADRKG
jgi:hypothetical protein